jgi:hypothetical protein
MDREKPLINQPLFLFYLFIVIYAGIHVLTWTLIRYRLPIDALLVIFAGLGITDLLTRIPKLNQWIQQYIEI